MKIFKTQQEHDKFKETLGSKYDSVAKALGLRHDGSVPFYKWIAIVMFLIWIAYKENTLVWWADAIVGFVIASPFILILVLTLFQ